MVMAKKIKKQNSRTERYIISKLCEDKLKKIDLQEIFHKNGKLYTCKLCMYFNLNKNKADALDHYTTKHAHISGVFCQICYKNFQSIGAAKDTISGRTVYSMIVYYKETRPFWLNGMKKRIKLMHSKTKSKKGIKLKIKVKV